jgi:hypothetical protein
VGLPDATAPGTLKNLFDLRRAAMVHNLHVIARHEPANGYQLTA